MRETPSLAVPADAAGLGFPRFFRAIREPLYYSIPARSQALGAIRGANSRLGVLLYQARKLQNRRERHDVENGPCSVHHGHDVIYAC